MTEVWLHSNRRVLLLAMVPAALLGGGSLVMLWLKMPALRIVAWLGLGMSTMLFVGLLQQMLRPRIAYRDSFVCFYLKAGKPIQVPIQFVEAFFLGQGPAHLPGADHKETKTMNLVARLSQRETSWAKRDVKEALGNWQDGYVTIRGTWCEPLTADVVEQLNRRLSAASQLAVSEEKE